MGGDTEKWDVRHNFVDKNESWCGIPKETRGIEEDRGNRKKHKQKRRY